MTSIFRCSELVSPSTILSLLSACKSIRNLQQVHSLIIRSGVEQDHFIITRFISLSDSLSSTLSYQTSIFDRVLQPNLYLWNTLIKDYTRRASLDDSIALFLRMQHCEVVIPDKYTFPSLIKACSVTLRLIEGRKMHGLTVRYGTDIDVFVGSSLVDMYGKCGEIMSARKMFDEMGVRNEVSWTSMIVGYANAGDLNEARNLFDKMPNRNTATWNAMITAFVRFGDLTSARKLFDEMPERNMVSFTTMIDGHAKAGDMVSSRSLFDLSPERDIISWSALITGYVQNGLPDQAVNVFIEMQSNNIKADEFIIVNLLSACSQKGSLELAKWVDSYVTENKNAVNLHQPHILAALIDMHVKCGNMERATVLFETMPKHDLISYCSMIQGESLHGRGSQAVALFDKMIKDEGLKPDHVAFTVILTACSHAGLVDEGCRYFDSMVYDYSLVPHSEHYACIVDLLGRSGKLRTAYEILKSVKMELDAAAWGALLGACKLHCEVELGEEVAAYLFKVEPENGSNYVLLSNIYATANRWLDVSRLRRRMNESGVRKVPGCSLIYNSLDSIM
ncbi:putative pentatricopeptide repeat-containing protein At5g37570 [Impatiens glandulifera]|uniref:putative pentatricopeptide repeat-containing protein At5g37570 n=1 Tax=Impatiens glandulifera TaxID=253017 RepID=UPI001FB174C6|nr:putative pentatricopeptide repeat-containing protein At5g37570 [Impatiens glandulifera]